MHRILLVEDDVSLAEALNALFVGEGYSVMLAADGIFALAEIARWEKVVKAAHITAE